MTPSRFREELQRFDKSLDFVFNGRRQRWEIVGRDRRNQKYLIASFKLGQLDKLGLEYLRDMAEVSPTKSSAKEVNRRIDRIIEDEEKAEEKKFQNSVNDRLDDAWTHFQYAEGSRVSMATIGAGEHVYIRDKRRFIDDSKRTPTTHMPDVLIDTKKL